MRFHRLFACALAAGISLVETFGMPVYAGSDKPVVVFSNSFNANNWRRTAVASFTAAAEGLMKDGAIANYQVVNGDGTPTQQNTQLGEIVMRKPDILIVDAASDSALNGTIRKACDAGIVVIAFDGLVTEPCAYKLDYSYDYNADFVKFAGDKLGGKGNVLVVRGMPSVSQDVDIYKQQMEALKQFPDLKVVGEVYGNWNPSVAQTAVANILPSLPKIDLVLNQGGGDGYGIGRAFEQFDPAYAEKPPLVMASGDAESIGWWIEQKRKSGYDTRSGSTAPSASAVALYMGLEILGGAKVPNKTVMPFVWITSDNLADYANMTPGEQAAPVYTREWVRENILGAQ